MQCFSPGSRAIVFEDHVPETSLVDGFGTKVWSAGGYDRKTVYKMVDAKFIDVCNEVCGIREASVLRGLINNLFNGPKANKINQRMQRFVTQEKCNSPRLKRFEDGLLAIYQHFTIPAKQSNRFYRGYYQRVLLHRQLAAFDYLEKVYLMRLTLRIFSIITTNTK